MLLLSSRPAPRADGPGRRSRLRAVAGLGVVTTAAALVTAGGLATAAPAEAAPETGAQAVEPASRFTFPVLPDTQFYSRYAKSEFERPDRYGEGNNPFAAQTRWLAEHADELNSRSSRTWATWWTR